MIAPAVKHICNSHDQRSNQLSEVYSQYLFYFIGVHELPAVGSGLRTK